MNEGVTQNEVYYRKVDELEPVSTKEVLSVDDQLLLVKNDSAKRTSLGAVMDKILEFITIPQYTINATPTNTDDVSYGTLTASSEIIGTLTQGLIISVNLRGVLETTSTNPWSLALTLTKSGETLTYPIYTPAGVQVTDQYPLTNEVFKLVFMSDVQLDADNTITGWFIPDIIHDHDDRYYLTNEVDAKLAQKSDKTHLHDDRYYQKTEIDEVVESINTAVIPVKRGGTGATNVVSARKNLGVNPWVVVGKNDDTTMTNSGYYKVFGVSCDTVKAFCAKVRISPQDSSSFNFIPVEISILFKRSDTAKSTPVVYCNTGVDYYGILSKFYIAYDAETASGNIELWYKNNSTYNMVRVTVSEFSTDASSGDSDGLEFVDFATDNTPLDAIDASLTTVLLMTDIVTEKVATETSSGLISAEDYKKLQSTSTQDALSAHILDTDNPHDVTKEQIGLDKVDNTADADKEVKSAVSATNDRLDQDIASTYIKKIDTGFTVITRGQSSIGGISVEFPNAVKHSVTFSKGDDTEVGKFETPEISDYNVFNVCASKVKAYITGTISDETNTGFQVFDTGVYLDEEEGTLVATKFKGALEGNADSATKLGSDTVGSESTPVYLNEGVATPCAIPTISTAQVTSDQFTAGEVLAENDLILLDSDAGTWFKSTTARTYSGVAMIATSSAAYTTGDTVTANIGMMRTVTAETVGNLDAKSLVLIQGTLGEDGVSFTTDGTFVKVRSEGYSYIRAGYLYSATEIVLSGTNPQILSGESGSSGSSSTSSGLTSNDCVAGEDLTTNDIVLKDAQTGKWYKATTARDYMHGVSMVGIVNAEAAVDSKVDVCIDGKSRFIDVTLLGWIPPAEFPGPIYVRGRSDGVKFTTDGTCTQSLVDGHDYIEICNITESSATNQGPNGVLAISNSGSCVTGVPKVNYRYGIRTPVTTNTGYIHRNIAYGTSATPTSDSTYGGSGSIYIYYS